MTLLDTHEVIKLLTQVFSFVYNKDVSKLPCIKHTLPHKELYERV